MAKIERDTSRLDTVLKQQKPLHKAEKLTKQSSFSLVLERQKKTKDFEHPPENTRLQQLFIETDKEARSLRLHFSIVQLRRYQQALATFMRQVVDFGLSLDHQNQHFRLQHRKRKRYTIVKVIDEQAEQLTQLLLEKQLPQIIILEKVNKIQGLIVDLLS